MLQTCVQAVVWINVRSSVAVAYCTRQSGIVVFKTLKSLGSKSTKGCSMMMCSRGGANVLVASV